MVHQYKLNGYNVVLDVYSGAIHVVDDVAYDIIRLFCDKNAVPELDEVKAAFPELSDEDAGECYGDI